MSNFIKKFIDEIDELIKEEYSGIVYDLLPVNFSDDNWKITPIFQTYVLDEDHDCGFTIFKITSKDNDIFYLQLQFGDGGVVIGRSEPTKNLESLKFKTEEGWSKLNY